MTIRILDPATVNQIAAGEVVERPASVVKELVENAIDSGASGSVSNSHQTGRSRASGSPMTGAGCLHDDALLAFTPHATSKIKTIDDLHHIRTLGFRGEALASIAAVSRVTLVTKTGQRRPPGRRLLSKAGRYRNIRSPAHRQAPASL